MDKRTSARFIARMIEGSRPGPMPGFIPPQLATLRTKVPEGDQWLHKIKFDGYRVQARLKKHNATLYTRGGHDWTDRFGTIAGALDYPLETAILDGEVIVEKDGGVGTKMTPRLNRLIRVSVKPGPELCCHER